VGWIRGEGVEGERACRARRAPVAGYVAVQRHHSESSKPRAYNFNATLLRAHAYSRHYALKKSDVYCLGTPSASLGECLDGSATIASAFKYWRTPATRLLPVTDWYLETKMYVRIHECL
jgi:hypothetical protein